MRFISFIISICLYLTALNGYAFDINTPWLMLNTQMHYADVNGVSADREGKTFLTCSDDKTARLWDAGDGHLLKVMHVPAANVDRAGLLKSCALSPDGTTAALSGSTLDTDLKKINIYIYDTATGEMTQRLTGPAEMVGDLQFSPDGERLAVGINRTGLKVYRNRDGVFELESEDNSYNDIFSGLDFDKDGALVTVSHDGYIRLYREDFSLKEKLKLADGVKPDGAAFSPDGKKIAVGYRSGSKVDIFDGETLEHLYSADVTGVNGELGNLAFDSKGRLYAVGRYGQMKGVQLTITMRRWDDEGRGAYKDIETARNSVFGITVLPDDSVITVGAYPDITKISTSGKKLFYLAGEIVDFKNAGTLHSFSVNNDGTKVSFRPLGMPLLLFDINSRELRESDETFEKYKDANAGVTLGHWRNYKSFTYNGKWVGLPRPTDYLRSVDIGADGTTVMGGDSYIYVFDKNGKGLANILQEGAAWALKISGDGEVLVAAHDGIIIWYRTSDWKQIASLYIHPDGKRWILYTPDGYYDASPGADRLVGWQLNRGFAMTPEFFSLGKFSGKFYRPDVMEGVVKFRDIQKALAYADEQRGKKTVVADIKDMLPPAVKILSPDGGSVFSSSDVVVRYTISNPSGGRITGVKFLIDGRPQGDRAIKAVLKEGEGEYRLSLPNRDCEISVIAENMYSASEPAAVKLRWYGEDSFVIKPKLYVLAVGVSSYADANLKLGYAAKDASDFVKVLMAQKGKMYRDVSVKLLTDSNATKGDVLDGLDWVLHETTHKDVAMVFMAGHGVNDDYGNYYYLPENTDVSRLKRTGVPYSDIKDTVSNIAGKALFFIDTCHSGNVMGQRRGVADTNGIVNELASAENGVVVFTSSTGNQYSLEDPSWGNGAFTKALVEGLSGKAAYNGSRITLNMLDLYISERVKELTGGRQTPATAKPNTIQDFPVAIK